MDKNAIKKYAVWARRELIERVSQRALRFGITADGNADPKADSVDGYLLSAVEKKQRAALIKKVEEHGYEQVLEEAAYTWFNRFAALRFMEVNGYLPSHVRVFTNEEGEFKPQILAEAIHLELDGLNMDKVYELKDANNTEELYRYLLIVQCNALSSILPGMFQRIEDYTELLLPENLLREGSVIKRLVNDIPEEDFDVSSENGQIEIIGWMYQYYISEKHEEVVDSLHGKVVKKEEVPAATQLFTTDWVVRYLIDNSVGRYWIERNPDSTLADKLTYFVKPKDGIIKTINEKIMPQEVTVFDPCVGSGHFLVYAFEVLMHIYVEYGYTESEAATEIVKNNLFGIDIDGRATQLAYFAVMMKARQYDRRFLTRKIQPNVYEILESDGVDKTILEHFYDNDSTLRNDIEAIIETMQESKEYGSILRIPVVNFSKINERFEEIIQEPSLYNTYLLGDFKSLIRVADVMSKKYAVVATNPPYMNKYDTNLKKFITANYADAKGDLFSVFMYRNFGFCLENGYSCFMTPYVWMFIKTYEKLRKEIIANRTITTLIQMEYSAYEEATVPICAFVLQNAKSEKNGVYFRLTNFKGGMLVQQRKTIEALQSRNCSYIYETNQKRFKNIPGEPIVYWITDQFIQAFLLPTVKDIANSCIGMRTGDNARFLRYWYEVNNEKIGFGLRSARNAVLSMKKWIPFHKGGDFRRWYGNLDYVVNWENNGYEIKENTKKTYPQLGDNLNWKITNEKHYFKEGITWTAVSSAKTGFRRYYEGFIFSNAGQAIISENGKHLDYLEALLNCKVTVEILQMIAPTIRFESGEIGKIPVCIDSKNYDTVVTLAKENTNISKSEWDSFEISWDFQSHPLISTSAIHSKTYSLVSDFYNQWKQKCNISFNTLKSNEEELNRIFIDIYGLQDELTPNVADKDITVTRIYDTKEEIPESMKGNNYVLTKEDVIKSFISYAVGCMFGRYSLDVEGLAYAGGDWDASKYKTFLPDRDAIIPICDDEYFEDDIVGRFVQFVEVVYGKETLEENLQFIADALGGRGTSREVIRNYFVSSFYADHVKTYKKRPIYWLFDSGKKNGFKCLIYMHRYQPDTLARIRTDYIHEQQSRYRTVIESLEQRIAAAGSSSEKVKLTKLLNTRQAQAKEIREYEEKVHHLADQMIKIDLDDGVKHNYAIFKDVLAKIK